MSYIEPTIVFDIFFINHLFVNSVAEYRDKILFPHGRERIIKRFEQFFALHPEAEGKSKRYFR